MHLTEAQVREMDAYFLRYAYAEARRSPDMSTQNGAVIVNKQGFINGSGCNAPPPKVELTPERLQRPLKYAVTEHAERAAIYSTQYNDGVNMYALWAACADCARGIILSGITQLVTHSFYPQNERWSDSIAIGMEMLEEAGVAVRYTDVQGMPEGATLLHNGRVAHY